MERTGPICRNGPKGAPHQLDAVGWIGNPSCNNVASVRIFCAAVIAARSCPRAVPDGFGDPALGAGKEQEPRQIEWDDGVNAGLVALSIKAINLEQEAAIWASNAERTPNATTAVDPGGAMIGS